MVLGRSCAARASWLARSSQLAEGLLGSIVAAQPYHRSADLLQRDRFPGAAMRFLIVDDSSTMRRIIINTLHKLGRLLAATEEVFETMVFTPLSARPPLDGDVAVPPANVVATVAFAGHRCGLVSFRSSIGAARAIAGAMLGEPADALNRDMPD